MTMLTIAALLMIEPAAQLRAAYDITCVVILFPLLMLAKTPYPV